MYLLRTFLGSIVVVLALGLTTAQAANVNINIAVTSCPDGTARSVAATWSSDPNAVINVTRVAAPGEVWQIDLSSSGHQVPGAPWPAGFFKAAWGDPAHAGRFSNLRIDAPQSMTLVTHATTAVGDNLGDYPNGFNNGVSYYAGDDFNGDSVFPRIVETQLPECVDPAIEQLEIKLDVLETKLDDQPNPGPALEALEAKLDRLGPVVDQLLPLLQQATAERAALEAKLDRADAERSALEAKLDALQQALARAETERAALEVKLDKSQSDRDAFQQEAIRAARERAALETKLDTMTQKTLAPGQKK